MTNISSNITCIIEEMDLTKLSKTELLSKCEEHGIKKYKSKNKSQLINLINIEIQSKKKVESIMEYDETEKLQSSSSKNDDNQQININYSNLSINLTKNIISKEKKNFGIYFTPPNTIIKNIKILEPYISNIKNVLDPSCGSCEYVLMLNQQYDLNIVGIK